MCKLIRIFYLSIPVHGFRAFLIQKHFSTCAGCQKEWGMDLNAQESFAKPEWIARELNLWPKIQGRIQAGELEETLSARRKKRILFPRWQWVVAAGSVLLILRLLEAADPA